MKKRFLLSLIFALNINIINATIPYYMKNTDSSKIDAIKTDNASCGCGDGDCNGGSIKNPFAGQDERNSLSSEKTNATQASCGCGDGDCNGGEDFKLPFNA